MKNLTLVLLSAILLSGCYSDQQKALKTYRAEKRTELFESCMTLSATLEAGKMSHPYQTVDSCAYRMARIAEEMYPE